MHKYPTKKATMSNGTETRKEQTKAQHNAKEAARTRCWADEEGNDDLWMTEDDPMEQQDAGNWVTAIVEEKTNDAIRQGKWNKAGMMEALEGQATAERGPSAPGLQRRSAWQKHGGDDTGKAQDVKAAMPTQHDATNERLHTAQEEDTLADMEVH